MFNFFKVLFNYKKIKKEIKNEIAKRNKWLVMSNEEFALLPEDELFEAALMRTEKIVDEYDDIIDGVRALSGAKRIFYVTSYYEMEVNNGGLCQFFVNSSRYVAPELSSSLEEIGAFEHKVLYDKFIQENKIDVNDLSSFDIDDVDEFEEQTKRYPFEQFDDAFLDIKPICEYLTEYVKKNITQF